MAKTVYAVVESRNYVFRGHQISRGRVVRMPASTFENATRSTPADFREAKASEIERAEKEGAVLDLFSVAPAVAANVPGAEPAEAPKK